MFIKFQEFRIFYLKTLLDGAIEEKTKRKILKKIERIENKKDGNQFY